MGSWEPAAFGRWATHGGGQCETPFSLGLLAYRATVWALLGCPQTQLGKFSCPVEVVQNWISWLFASLVPWDPEILAGKKQVGHPQSLGTSRACGTPRALSKKSPKLLLEDKAGRTGGAGSFGKAWMPLALSQTQHWLWAAELPKPHLNVAPQTSLVRLLLPITPFLLSSTPRPNRPHGWSRPAQD